MASPTSASPGEVMETKAESPSSMRRDSRDLKRKASLDYDEHPTAGSPKRSRRDSYNDYRRTSRSPSPYSQRRRPSVDERRQPHDDPANRKPASLEEKKRGKRLFGGMLNTLSQTNTNSQQKRRLEIEKRQQQRIKQERAEDDERRQEKVARLTKVRMAEQIGFEKQVMEKKHATMQWTAKHIKTRARPHIYYRPWRLTEDQENLIDDQIQDTKALIEREQEAFRGRERRHQERYGSRKMTPSPRSNRTEGRRESKASNTLPTPSKIEDSNTTAATEAEANRADHDDSHEVVMETNEDTVIY